MCRDRFAVFPSFLLSLAVAAGLAACDSGGRGDGKPATAQAQPADAPPPPEVGVVTVVAGSVAVPTELPGRVEALRTSQVRARVTGIVQKRMFREGSDVKAGQPLFQIDPAPYKASLDSARATLAKAQANLTQAAALANRYKPLREANAISEQEYVNAQALQGQALADVAAARAAVQTAELNLGYARVTAPISGRIGRALVTEGALVSQAEATQMAVIQQIDPVYVNFTQSAADLQRLRRALSSGKAKSVTDAPVHIVMEDGTELAVDGRLLFSDLSVDPTSGQVTLRAEVPNVDGTLLPGLYVRGRLPQYAVDQAMLVPQQAVTRSAQADTLMVVGPENKPVPRTVKIGGAQGTQWVVLEGLKPGERVIVDGFQKMRPGAPVKPVKWTGAGAASAPTGAAPASGAGR